MALYRCSFQNITRSEGRSAVAAAAYRASEKVTNEWDGVTHDFTKKQGIVHTEILLPPGAPVEYSERSYLWNAVETSEKSTRARLCRECLLALPVELSREQQIHLVRDYVEQNFVALGMCADVAIHDPHKSGQSNPHAHILLTVRPISVTGEWEPKTQAEYRCRRGTEERGFTAEEFHIVQADGWEKEYRYRTQGKKLWLTPTEAADLGLSSSDRVSRSPCTTPHGRENPTAARWNSPEQLRLWRQSWADCINKKFKALGMPERVDHRSYADQGREELPGVHTGSHPGRNALEINAAVAEYNAMVTEYRKTESALRARLAATKKELAGYRQKLAANQLSAQALSRSISDLNRVTQQDADAAEKAQSTLDLLGAVTDDAMKTIAALEQAIEALGQFQFGRRRELIHKLEEVQQKLDTQTSYLRTQLSQRGFSDQSSIDAAKKEISRRRQEINTLNESLLQLQAEAEDIQQQLSETLSAVPEQYKSEVLTHEPPKEEKNHFRTR